MRYVAAFAGAALISALAAATGLAQSLTGGTFASAPPAVSDVVCRTSCAGIRVARAGSVVRLHGSDLAGASAVVFTGGVGTRDDRRARPSQSRDTWLDVRVPRRARPGRLVVESADGRASRPSRRPLAMSAPTAPERAGALSIAATPPISLEVAARRIYLGGTRRARLDYLVHDSAAVQATVDVVRARDGAVVMTWPATTVAPGAPQTVVWDGRTGDGQAVEEEGRYAFRVTTDNGRGVIASSAQADNAGTFTVLRHIFPVRGKHDYGEFAASFGGGRGHQGHDVFAACGTPVVAARAGVVQVKSWHDAAGNYVVIDGDDTGQDYVYMHLRDAAAVEVGDRVRTGQTIGHVGATGRASGCHLHFELWTAPGWYAGGSPLDPLPVLRAWDARS